MRIYEHLQHHYL